MQLVFISISIPYRKRILPVAGVEPGFRHHPLHTSRWSFFITFNNCASHFHPLYATIKFTMRRTYLWKTGWYTSLWLLLVVAEEILFALSWLVKCVLSYILSNYVCGGRSFFTHSSCCCNYLLNLQLWKKEVFIICISLNTVYAIWNWSGIQTLWKCSPQVVACIVLLGVRKLLPAEQYKCIYFVIVALCVRMVCLFEIGWGVLFWRLYIIPL